MIFESDFTDGFASESEFGNTLVNVVEIHREHRSRDLTEVRRLDQVRLATAGQVRLDLTAAEAESLGNLLIEAAHAALKRGV